MHIHYTSVSLARAMLCPHTAPSPHSINSQRLVLRHKMRQAGPVAAADTLPRRSSAVSSLAAGSQRRALSSKVDATKPLAPVTRTIRTTQRAPSSPVKRSPFISPPSTLAKPPTSPSRRPIRHSPHHPPTVSIKHTPQANIVAVKKRATPPTSAAVQVWTFDEKDDSDQHQPHWEHGQCQEQPPRTIPLSALLGWSSSDCSVLSFQSLSVYSLPPLPSYDTIPPLCAQLTACGSTSSVDESYAAVCALREFGASDLLASPNASLIVSSLVSAVLKLGAPLLPVSTASLQLLADLYDAADSSHVAAELYLSLVQHVIDAWQGATHWPHTDCQLWLEDDTAAETHSADSSSGEETIHLHSRPSHAHLTRLFRVIAIIQRQLPTQWVYFSPSTHHAIVRTTLQLHATAVSSLSTSLLSPAHMLAVADPTCSWLPLWLFQLPTRKLVLRLLASSTYTSLLDWLAATPRTAATSAQSTVSPTISCDIVFSLVTSETVACMYALQRGRFVECLMKHASGERLLGSAWERLGVAARSKVEVQSHTQNLHTAALCSFAQTQCSCTA